MNRVDLPKRGQRLRLEGALVFVEVASVGQTGVDLVVRPPGGAPYDKSISWEAFAVARVPENDGAGHPERGFAALWGSWIQYASPRLRSAALATRPLNPYAHQDEALFDHLLPPPKLRLLLADEPGTGKTIMTGMYLVEGRRQGWRLAHYRAIPANSDLSVRKILARSRIRA